MADKLEPYSAWKTLCRLLEEAGARVCFCLTCSHQPAYGPCAACGCKNLPYDQRLNQQKEEEDGRDSTEGRA